MQGRPQQRLHPPTRMHQRSHDQTTSIHPAVEPIRPESKTQQTVTNTPEEGTKSQSQRTEWYYHLQPLTNNQGQHLRMLQSLYRPPKDIKDPSPTCKK